MDHEQPVEQPLARVLSAVAIAAPVVALGYVIAHFGELPAQVPLNFDWQGRPGEPGRRELLFAVPVLALLLQGLLALLARHPDWGNYPVAVTAANRERLFGLFGGTMLFLRVLLAALLSTLAILAVEVARGRSSGLHSSLVGGILAVLVGGLVAFVVVMRRAAPGPRAGAPSAASPAATDDDAGG